MLGSIHGAPFFETHILVLIMMNQRSCRHETQVEDLPLRHLELTSFAE